MSRRKWLVGSLVDLLSSCLLRDLGPIPRKIPRERRCHHRRPGCEPQALAGTPKAFGARVLSPCRETLPQFVCSEDVGHCFPHVVEVFCFYFLGLAWLSARFREVRRRRLIYMSWQEASGCRIFIRGKEGAVGSGRGSRENGCTRKFEGNSHMAVVVKPVFGSHFGG